MKLLQPLQFLILFCFLIATGCHKPLYIQERSTQLYTVSKTDPVDSAIVKMLAPYKIGVDTQMQTILGRTDIPLTKAQPESTLGNFMADAQMVAAKKIDNKVVGSVMNYGGIRLSYIAPGILTRGKMYELMPFDNMLTIVDVPGEVLKQFCNHMVRYKGWPISGISYVIKDKEATNILINGSPINDHIVYKIAMSDYIARGGDNCDFLSPLRKRFTTIFVRDAMIEYVMELEKQNKPLHPNLENRIQYAE
ncbi:MAG TPA: 5'-nucleotidase C-terminal domain-containing protein [Flavipsychrobacter sp.]|nr:5'-nucleotidase C-terminal domain-containing protein [Flavipsychrobacter sp.]